jgi:hypothetical protein
MISFIAALFFLSALPLSILAIPTPDAANILIPNEKGELVYATSAQLRARSTKYATSLLSKRDACSDQDPPNPAGHVLSIASAALR